jgi:hypothetical protein
MATEKSKIGTYLWGVVGCAAVVALLAQLGVSHEEAIYGIPAILACVVVVFVLIRMTTLPQAWVKWPAFFLCLAITFLFVVFAFLEVVVVFSGERHPLHNFFQISLGRPTEFTALSGSNKIALNWQNRDSAEATFELDRRTSNESPFQRIAYLPVGVTAFTDTGVQPDQNYEYRIRADRMYFWNSDWTPVSVTTLPSPLNVVPSVVNEHQVTLTITGDRRRSIEIARRTGGAEKSFVLPPGETTLVDLEAPPGTAITYDVCSPAT